MARILVVDDEPAIRDFVVACLRKRGNDVWEAENGLQAEKLMLENSFGLAISDIQMPEMNGIELLKRVRFVNPQIRFIVMTGFHQPGNIPSCLKHNVSRYLRKPFRLADLLDAVTNALEEQTQTPVRLSDATPGGWFEMEMTSTEDSLTRVYAYMVQYLCDSLQETPAKRIAHGLYEMIHNAMEWGNQREAHKLVRFGCMVLSDSVVFRIQDEGNGFDVVEEMCPVTDVMAVQAEREGKGKRPGGLGIHITQGTMDHFFYNEQGNCLIMSKQITDDDRIANPFQKEATP